MHVDGLLSANLCLVTLLYSEQLYAVWKFPRATHLKGKQNIQFQTKIFWQ